MDDARERLIEAWADRVDLLSIAEVLDFWTTEHRNDLLAVLDATSHVGEIDPRWPDHEWANVSGAIMDTGNLPGDLTPGEAIRRLTAERDQLAALLRVWKGTADRLAVQAERYHEALEAIANADYAHGWTRFRIRSRARRALSEQEQE